MCSSGCLETRERHTISWPLLLILPTALHHTLASKVAPPQPASACACSQDHERSINTCNNTVLSSPGSCDVPLAQAVARDLRNDFLITALVPGSVPLSALKQAGAGTVVASPAATRDMNLPGFIDLFANLPVTMLWSYCLTVMQQLLCNLPPHVRRNEPVWQAG